MPEIVVENLNVWYGRVHALRAVNLRVGDGECVAVLGTNGAGKTTLFRSISRLVSYEGEVRLDGIVVRGQPEDVVRQGIGHVLEGRHIFTQLSVRENLLLAKFGSRASGFEDRFASVLDFFPLLKDNLNRLGGQLSGGQQQVLAIARGLLTAPKVLMMDEPSLGLAPVVVEQLAASIPAIRNTWRTTLLISEQSIQLALDVADRVYVLERGKVVHSGPAELQVLGDELVTRYLGVRNLR